MAKSHRVEWSTRRDLMLQQLFVTNVVRLFLTVGNEPATVPTRPLSVTIVKRNKLTTGATVHFSSPFSSPGGDFVDDAMTTWSVVMVTMLTRVSQRATMRAVFTALCKQVRKAVLMPR